MATYIDGIGASENIDSSGERILIAGMDISSLAIDGVFNWEHNKDQPSQIVGKVLFAKKIFSDQDCDDDRQLYFWQKCQTPFVYVMGELMDDYKDSAKEVAGMFRYDSDKREQNERNVMNFSIEGAKIDKQGIDIVKSIARKVTITVLPCNKAAIAEMVPNPTAKPKDDIDSLFKTETNVEIELIKSEDMGKFLDTLKKNVPHLKLATQADPRGTHIGKTKSGKSIHSHEKVHNYEGFHSQDHKDAANLHYEAIKSGGDPKMNQHHMGKMKLHMQAAMSSERKEKRGELAVANARANVMSARNSGPAQKPQSSVARPYAKVDNIKKATTLGSANVAPGQLTGGAATTKSSFGKVTIKETPKKQGFGKIIQKADEKGVHIAPDAKKPGASLAGNLTRTGKPAYKEGVKAGHKAVLNTLKQMPKPNLTKSDFWLKRAEEEYANWDKKEQFRAFMSIRMPKMTKSEIDAFGATMVLKKVMESEAVLEDMSKALKFGTPADQAATAKFVEEQKNKPKAPKKEHVKAPDLKSKVHSEVSHVKPMSERSDEKYDTVHLKSGHELHGHPKGKFKVGDKVTAKPHIMGTHLLEHGHND